MLEIKKKLHFCFSFFSPVYCWFLLLMLLKLFCLCGKFEWESDLLRKGKEEKCLRYSFLEVFVMGGAVALGAALYL